MAVSDRDPFLVSDGDLFRVPPPNSNAGVLAVSIVLKGLEDWLFPCQLLVSRHILVNVIRVLKRKYDWSEPEILDYVGFIRDLAQASGGEPLFEPTSVVGDCGGDHEDGKILALARDARADLLVTEDTGLLHLTEWRGWLAIIPASEFQLRANDARALAAKTVSRPHRLPHDPEVQGPSPKRLI